jgi:hypothetical protein
VAEVGSEHTGRAGRIIRLETNAIPTGWVDPTQEGLDITVIHNPMPTEPGVYWTPNHQMSKKEYGEHHTDGMELHYLNSDGLWCDIGFGQPNTSQVLTKVDSLTV